MFGNSTSATTPFDSVSSRRRSLSQLRYAVGASRSANGFTYAAAHASNSSCQRDARYGLYPSIDRTRVAVDGDDRVSARIGELVGHGRILPGTMLIVQISDLHVAGAEAEVRRFVDTNANLARAIAYIEAMRPRPDLVVATGDLTDNGLVEEYQLLRELLDRFEIPVLPDPWEPRRAARRSSRCSTITRTFRATADRCSTWSMATCASSRSTRTRPGHHEGMVDAERLEWLDTTLSRRAERADVVDDAPPAVRHRDLVDGPLAHPRRRGVRTRRAPPPAGAPRDRGPYSPVDPDRVGRDDRERVAQHRAPGRARPRARSRAGAHCGAADAHAPRLERRLVHLAHHRVRRRRSPPRPRSLVRRLVGSGALSPRLSRRCRNDPVTEDGGGSTHDTGCSAVGSARALGARGRGFESRHPDPFTPCSPTGSLVLHLFHAQQTQDQDQVDRTRCACVNLSPLRV